jgi:hypothetical protein
MHFQIPFVSTSPRICFAQKMQLVDRGSAQRAGQRACARTRYLKHSKCQTTKTVTNSPHFGVHLKKSVSSYVLYLCVQLWCLNCSNLSHLSLCLPVSCLCMFIVRFSALVGLLPLFMFIYACVLYSMYHDAWIW